MAARMGRGGLGEIVFTLVIGLTVALSDATASPAAPVPIKMLVDSAELIVAGTVIEGADPGGAAALAIACDRVLKGPQAAGSVVSVVWQSPRGVRSPYPLKGVRGVFFLKRGPGARLELLPVIAGAEDIFEVFFVLPPAGPAPSLSASDSTVDKVARELAIAVEAGEGGPHRLGIDLVEFYRSTRSQALRKLLAGFAESTSERLQATGLRGMISSGDVAALRSVQAKPANFLESAWGGVVIREIQFHYANPDPAGVAILGNLATSNSAPVQLRTASAVALARIHTQATLPYLASLLESSDPVMRAAGVGGLAMFANNVPIGSHHPAQGEWRYRTAETMAHSAMDPSVISQKPNYYLGFWKQWWKEHQHELTKP